MRAAAFVALMVLCVVIAGCSSTAQGSPMETNIAARENGTMQGPPGSGFGAALAIDGNLAVVGAFLDGASREGAVYLYRYTNNAWTLEARLESTRRLPDGFFGSSVAVRDGWVAIVARNEGAVYVYRDLGGSWELTDRLQPSGTIANNRFGAGLALDDEWLAFNVEIDDLQTHEPSEAVYLYALTDGRFEPSHVIRAGPQQTGSFFGGSIALADDTLAVGASNQGPTSRSSGAVYLYDLSVGAPVLTVELTAPREVVAHAFGASLALAGNLLAVGSPGEDYGGYRSGPVVLFGRSGGSWDAISTLRPVSLSDDDRFGTDLALVGDDLLVAGYTDNDLPSGSTYTVHYKRSLDHWEEAPERVSFNSSNSARFTRIASDGAMLLVGVPRVESVSSVESFQLTRSAR